MWNTSTLQYAWPMTPSLTLAQRDLFRRAVTLLVEASAVRDSPGVRVDAEGDPGLAQCFCDLEEQNLVELESPEDN
eukprot:1414150-Alexandrium_andersonii.AAC.1